MIEFYCLVWVGKIFVAFFFSGKSNLNVALKILM